MKINKRHSTKVITSLLISGIAILLFVSTIAAGTVGTNVVQNGDFTNWTSGSPDGWDEVAIEGGALGNLTIEEDPTGVPEIEYDYTEAAGTLAGAGENQYVGDESGLGSDNDPQLEFEVQYGYGSNDDNFNLAAGVVELEFDSGEKLRYLNAYDTGGAVAQKLPDNTGTVHYVVQTEDAPYQDWAPHRSENISEDVSGWVTEPWSIEQIRVFTLENTGAGTGGVGYTYWRFDNVELGPAEAGGGGGGGYTDNDTATAPMLATVTPPVGGIQVENVDDNIDFGTVSPGDTQLATNNPFSFDVGAGENAADVYVKGTVLENSSAGVTIGVENIEHGTGSDPTTALSSSYDLIESGIPASSTQTVSENYQLNTPSSISGLTVDTPLTGTLTILAQDNAAPAP